MKTSLYGSPKVRMSLPFELSNLRVLLIAVLFSLTGLKTFSQNLGFFNPVLTSGTAGANNAVYRFNGVLTGYDALVTINGRSSSAVVLQDIDVTTTGCNRALQPLVGRTGPVSDAADWWMEFEIQFVKANTNQSATVNSYDLSAMSINGDGLLINEYVEFYKAKGITLNAPTQLIAATLGNANPNARDYRVTGPIGGCVDIDTANAAVMAIGNFVAQNKLTVRLGATSSGLGTSTEGMRYYSLSFSNFRQVGAGSLPVNLIAFNASLINKKVAVTWTTAAEKNASHYVVQRSTDGVDFTDAGTIFTEGNFTTNRSYSFQDVVNTNAKGVLYYRLKMVDMDGQYDYSMVRLVKLGDNNGRLELQAFPNPVVNELRVTIPEAWQNRQVVYELYTGDGQLLKRFLNKSATQTEIIGMQQYQPGVYIVKALNDAEMASQRIIKRK